MPKPYVLIILDGFGYRAQALHNAIAQAKTPTWDRLWQEAPHTLLSACGNEVGLEAGQMGNSEVGHLNIGAGRIIYQDSLRISQAIKEGPFFQNTALLKAIQIAKETKRRLHVMSLLSPGGVHSDEQHLFAFLKLCQQQDFHHLAVHAFLDGRDTPPQSAQSSLERLERVLTETAVGTIATLMGRYYAMDRDQRWDRTALAYKAIALHQAAYHADTALDALKAAYQRKETDEFVAPTLIGKERLALETGDTVVFLNFRADRARQLTKALIEPSFTAFERPLCQLGLMVTLTRFYEQQPALAAFEVQTHAKVLGAHLQDLGLTQLRLAETEKYAHVTFFFNGGQELPFQGEDRLLIPSPQVATYDLKPDMSATALSAALVRAIEEQKHDVIVCNFANADMVGHTGQLKATIQAIECLDQCLAVILNALSAVQGEALITADHGNAELMYDENTHQPHTAHTLEQVPLVYVGPQALQLKNGGILADVAPTLLTLMHLPIPKEMTGHHLVDYGS